MPSGSRRASCSRFSASSSSRAGPATHAPNRSRCSSSASASAPVLGTSSFETRSWTRSIRGSSSGPRSSRSSRILRLMRAEITNGTGRVAGYAAVALTLGAVGGYVGFVYRDVPALQGYAGLANPIWADRPRLRLVLRLRHAAWKATSCSRRASRGRPPRPRTRATLAVMAAALGTLSAHVLCGENPNAGLLDPRA